MRAEKGKCGGALDEGQTTGSTSKLEENSWDS